MRSQPVSFLVRCAVAALPLVAAAPSAKAQAVADVSALQWLAGDWQGSGGQLAVSSHFDAPAGGVLLGTQRYLTAAGVLSFFEFDLIKTDGDHVTLTPYPFGAPGVTFTATELAPGHVVFTNPTHPYPHEIEFLLTPSGELYTRVEGDQNGQHVRDVYLQTKGF